MSKYENREALDALFKRLCTDFGQASGEAIMRTIIEELGGLRVSVPDLRELEREERGRRIRARFNGTNYCELAECFTNPKGEHLSVRQVRNIVDGERHVARKAKE